MALRVLACDREGATLAAPLQPNINHRATVFGGSLSAVAILSGWTWLHYAAEGAGLKCRLVIQRNAMEYLAPIAGDFEARCRGLAPDEFEKFARQFRRAGKARVTLAADVFFHGQVCAQFHGDYVALAP